MQKSKSVYEYNSVEYVGVNGWSKAPNNIRRKNPRRTIYTDGNYYYSLDTQHGRFEKIKLDGTHTGEIDMNLKVTKKPDREGNHVLEVK